MHFQVGATPQKERSIIQILIVHPWKCSQMPISYQPTLPNSSYPLWTGRRHVPADPAGLSLPVPAHIPMQPPRGFALGWDAAVLSLLAGGTRSPDPYCTAASAAAKHPGRAAWSPANSVVLHVGKCQAEAARRADVRLAHGRVFPSVVTNKHH